MNEPKLKCPECAWEGDGSECPIVGLRNFCPRCANLSPWVLREVQPDTTPPPLSANELGGNEGGLVTAPPSEDKTPVYCPDCIWTGEMREAQTLDTPLKGRIKVCPDCMSNAEVLPEKVSQTPVPTGIEALVCADIAARQQIGIKKYGRTVAESPDDMLRHAVEEAYDLSVYLRAEIEKRQKRRCHVFDPLEVYLPAGWALEELGSEGGRWIVHSPDEASTGFDDRWEALEFVCAEEDLRAEMERRGKP